MKNKIDLLRAIAAKSKNASQFAKKSFAMGLCLNLDEAKRLWPKLCIEKER